MHLSQASLLQQLSHQVMPTSAANAVKLICEVCSSSVLSGCVFFTAMLSDAAVPSWWRQQLCLATSTLMLQCSHGNRAM